MNITQGLHRAVQQTPNLPATVFGERSRTWRESADRVARLAAALRGLGVAAGDRVAILALNSDRFFEYLFAVPWADAVLNPINVRWSVQEIAFALRDSRTRILLVDDSFAGVVPELRAACPDLTTVIHCGDGRLPTGLLSYEELVSANAPIPDAHRAGDALAGIFYTGGSTGRAKGVMLSHTNIVTSALGSIASGVFMEPGGRLLHAAPMFHLADLAAWIARSILGGTHVIVPSFAPGTALTAIARHRITEVLLVPTLVQALVDEPAAADADLSSLRRVICGGGAVTEAVLERAASVLPGCEFTQAYGMTESGPIATLLGPEGHRDPVRRRSAGRAAPHSEIRIVDADGAEAPTGAVGEIVIRGGHVMLGYWERPEETAEALREGWLHTGDGGRIDADGYLFIADRMKDMIKTGGENVYSIEVENALAGHPAVANCAVIGIPDPDWGERVHAVVVLAPGARPTEQELREHVKKSISGYKAPRSVEFVAALPTSGAGKVLKRELRAAHLDKLKDQVDPPGRTR